MTKDITKDIIVEIYKTTCDTLSNIIKHEIDGLSCGVIWKGTLHETYGMIWLVTYDATRDASEEFLNDI